MILNKSVVQRLAVVLASITLAILISYSALAAPLTLSRSYIIEPFYIDSSGTVYVEGLDRRDTTAGAPDLPFFSEVIEIPEGTEPTVTVFESNATRTVVGQIQPVAQMIVGENATESLLRDGYQTAYEKDATIYGTDAFFPQATYQVEKITLEDKPHLRITFYPVRYNGATETLLHIGSLNVQIELTPSRGTWNGTQELSVCCDLPLNPKTARTALPVGETTVKIEVDEAGIYELLHADLVALHPALNGANPNNFAMLTNGEAVAFQVMGGGDNSFDSGDSIRFYGWAYDGPRIDQQYVKHNVFWLWGNNGSGTIPTVGSPFGYNTRSTFRSEVTFEENLGHTSTDSNDWRFFENEADAWYWESWAKSGTAPALHTYPIELSDPVSSGADATITAELLAVKGIPAHSIEIGLSGSSATGSRTYPAVGSYNVTVTLPAADLSAGTNTVEITDTSFGSSKMFFNRLTVSYDRELTAVNDQLVFGRKQAAQSEFVVSGFSTDNPVTWDVTDRLNPVAIASGLIGSGSYSYRIASDHGDNAQFAAFAAEALLTPVAVSSYDVIELSPAAGADWVAVTHPDFASAVNTLATHRAAYSSLTTHVVDVEDVINQYGYGLATPNGIRDYIAHAVTNWTTAPRYLLLGGDASNNPGELDCVFCAGYFEIDKTYVPTFLPYSDRFIGQQPSDHPYALLTGSDELADIAVGRLTVESLAEANVVIDKIIQYETNLLTPEAYMQDVIFAVDAEDPSAAIYCEDSESIGGSFDNSLNPIYKCLPDHNSSSKTQVRSEIFNHINVTGTAIINYRGHGSAVDWAGGFISRDHAPDFANTDKPFVIITADCLDGHFAWYNLDTIGETFLRRPDVASAAHWSASGLGFSFEYNVLHEGFYEGLFDEGKTAIGDAIIHAKHNYAVTGYDSVTGFSMNLQGDPAMQVMRPEISVSLEPESDTVNVASTLDFTLRITNTGQYPSKVLLNVPLPSELGYASISSSTSHTVSTSANTVSVGFLEGLGSGESAEFILTVNVLSGAGGSVPVQLDAISAGFEITPGDESAVTAIAIQSVPTAIQLSQANTNQQQILLLLISVIALLFLTLAILINRRRQLVRVARRKR